MKNFMQHETKSYSKTLKNRRQKTYLGTWETNQNKIRQTIKFKESANTHKYNKNVAEHFYNEIVI